MSHPIEVLRKILAAPREKIAGIVVKSENNLLTVATTAGIVAASRAPGDSTAYLPGATVIVSGGVVTGRSEAGPVYVV